MISSASIKERLRPSLFTLAAAVAAILLVTQAGTRAGLHPSPTQDAFKVTTVFLVRHAEKADAPREDPPLSEPGKLRAQELARMLGGTGIKNIYTSQFLRTRQTAEPLAEQLGVTINSLPLSMSKTNPREVSNESIAEIVAKINEHAGETALVVGHSNTVPEVIRMLGGDVVPKIDEKVFDDFFVVTVYAKGKARVVQLKYFPLP
ncbi:MAG TPA: phosphoglycerate mutase family protein [Pyrinomonadaceae bacterium]|nr:phosphoglycerate mutase family protein [Pyrinomonadaceae bacterium]